MSAAMIWAQRSPAAHHGEWMRLHATKVFANGLLRRSVRASQAGDADSAAAGQPAQGRRDGGDGGGARAVPAGLDAGRRRRGRSAAADVPGAADRHGEVRLDFLDASVVST
jgi:hypothetical protein